LEHRAAWLYLLLKEAEKKTNIGRINRLFPLLFFGGQRKVTKEIRPTMRKAP
jgi:hypothetical protein